MSAAGALVGDRSLLASNDRAESLVGKVGFDNMTESIRDGEYLVKVDTTDVALRPTWEGLSVRASVRRRAKSCPERFCQSSAGQAKLLDTRNTALHRGSRKIVAR